MEGERFDRRVDGSRNGRCQRVVNSFLGVVRRAISQGVTVLLWTAIAFLAVANAYVNFMTAKPLPPSDISWRAGLSCEKGERWIGFVPPSIALCEKESSK